MYSETTIGVVVPAYNEAGFVGDVIETLPDYVDRAYVVDDCSTDDTWTEIRTTAKRVNDRTDGSGGGSVADSLPGDDRVVPIQHEENRGVGGAIKTGYRRSREDGIDVTVVMGGDGQMDPAELPKVIDPVVEGEADYVKGNRLLNRTDREEMPGFRYVGNVVLTYLTKIASGYWYVGDPQNGYAAISAAALEGAEIDRMFEFYGYCNDLLVRLSANGFRVLDVPISARYRDEESHIEYRTYVPLVSFMLLRGFLWRIVTRRSGPAENARSGLYLGGAFGLLSGLLLTVRSAFRGSSPAEGTPTEGPSTDAPTSDVPSSEVPSSEVPTTEEASSEAPTTEEASSEAPSIEAPVAARRPTATADGGTAVTDSAAARAGLVGDGADHAGTGEGTGRSIGRVALVVLGGLSIVAGMVADALINRPHNGKAE